LRGAVEPSRAGPEARDRNYVAAISSVARLTPGGKVRPVGGLTLVRSGLAISAFNCVFALRPAPVPTDAEREIRRTFADDAVRRWVLITTSSSQEAMTPLIDALGLRLVETMPGMLWDPLPSEPAKMPVGFVVRPLGFPDEVREFGRTMMRGFEAPPELMDAWADAVGHLPTAPPELRGWYLGWVSGQPVCTAVRYSTGALAGIYGVGTVPDFRQKGFGTAITQRAAIDGRLEGCTASYLQSSRIGRPVYERIGYRVVEEYQLWAPGADP